MPPQLDRATRTSPLLNPAQFRSKASDHRFPTTQLTLRLRHNTNSLVNLNNVIKPSVTTHTFNITHNSQVDSRTLDVNVEFFVPAVKITKPQGFGDMANAKPFRFTMPQNRLFNSSLTLTVTRSRLPLKRLTSTVLLSLACCLLVWLEEWFSSVTPSSASYSCCCLCLKLKLSKNSLRLNQGLIFAKRLSLSSSMKGQSSVYGQVCYSSA